MFTSASRLFAVFSAICLLSACSGLKTSCEQPIQITDEMLEPCPEPVYASDVGNSWQQAYEINAARWAECRIINETLRQAVEAANDD